MCLLIFVDTFQAHRGSASSSRFGHERDLEIANYNLAAIESANVPSNQVFYGTGLRNEVGEYNCFLNVIIQVSMRKFFIMRSMVRAQIISLLLLTLFFHCENLSHFGI